MAWGLVALIAAGLVWLLGFRTETREVAAVTGPLKVTADGPPRASGPASAHSSNAPPPSGFLDPAALRAASDYLLAVRRRMSQEDLEQQRELDLEQDITAGGLDDALVEARLKGHQDDQLETGRLQSEEEQAEADLASHDREIGAYAGRIRAHVARVTGLRQEWLKAGAALQDAKAEGADTAALAKQEATALAAYKKALSRKPEDL